MNRDDSSDFDKSAWESLVRYDPDVAEAVAQVRPFGRKYEDDLAASYLAIREKRYLSIIVSTIVKEAKAEGCSNGSGFSPQHQRSSASDNHRGNERNGPGKTRGDDDKEAWDFLCRHDPDIASAVALLRKYGENALEDFAASYLAINDKAYLQKIVSQIIHAAEAKTYGRTETFKSGSSQQAKGAEFVADHFAAGPKKPPYLLSTVLPFVIVLGALAGVSAFLSCYAPDDPWGLVRLGGPFSHVDLLPGVYFASVLVAGVYLWESKRILALGITFLFVVGAWVAAFRTAFFVQSETASKALVSEYTSHAIAGLTGGFVGSSITTIGILVVSANSRRLSVVLTTVSAGTILGLPLVFMGPSPVSLLPLFLAWQVGVAGCVAFAICAPQLVGQLKPRMTLLPPKRAAVVAFVLLAICMFGVVFEEGNKENNNVNLYSDDEAAFETYLATCRVCALTSEVIQRLAEVKAKHLDDQSFLSARGSLTALNAYVRDCRSCSHSDEATAEIASLQATQTHELQLEQESNQFGAAHGDIGKLRAYINSCSECQFRNAAITEVNLLEQKASQFDFVVCNQSEASVSVAVSYFFPPNSAWFIQGWWTVTPSQCSSLGKFQKGDFYYYAKELAGNLEWQGTFGLCVVFPGPFRFVNRGEACSNDSHKLFTTTNVQRDQYTWTIRPLVGIE